LEYLPPEGVKKSNMKLDRYERLEIVEIRDKLHEFSYQKNGFESVSSDGGMLYDDIDDE
jgi:hypothetical protein